MTKNMLDPGSLEQLMSEIGEVIQAEGNAGNIQHVKLIGSHRCRKHQDRQHRSRHRSSSNRSANLNGDATGTMNTTPELRLAEFPSARWETPRSSALVHSGHRAPLERARGILALVTSAAAARTFLVRARDTTRTLLALVRSTTTAERVNCDGSAPVSSESRWTRGVTRWLAAAAWEVTKTSLALVFIGGLLRVLAVFRPFDIVLEFHK